MPAVEIVDALRLNETPFVKKLIRRFQPVALSTGGRRCSVGCAP
jgi:hypothetical protein